MGAPCTSIVHGPVALDSSSVDDLPGLGTLTPLRASHPPVPLDLERVLVALVLAAVADAPVGGGLVSSGWSAGPTIADEQRSVHVAPASGGGALLDVPAMLLEELAQRLLDDSIL